jgi:hypothetical protein
LQPREEAEAKHYQDGEREVLPRRKAIESEGGVDKYNNADVESSGLDPF